MRDQGEGPGIFSHRRKRLVPKYSRDFSSLASANAEFEG